MPPPGMPAGAGTGPPGARPRRVSRRGAAPRPGSRTPPGPAARCAPPDGILPHRRRAGPALVGRGARRIVAVDANRRDPGVQPGGRGAVRPQPRRHPGPGHARDARSRAVPAAVRGRHGRLPGHRGRSGMTRPFRLRALRADGTERPVDLTPMPVTVAGETYFFGFLRDATELETATTALAEGDARFGLLSDLAPVGIMQSDADGTCRFVNDKWCEMAGIPAAERHRPELAHDHQPGRRREDRRHAGRKRRPGGAGHGLPAADRVRRRGLGARRRPPGRRPERAAWSAGSPR